MNKQLIMAMVHKEIKILFSSKKVWIPMLIVPLLLCVLLPAGIAYVGIHTSYLSHLDQDVKMMATNFVQKFPDGELKETFLSFKKPNLQLTFLYLNFMIMPFFLMSSIINSSVVAANSFAGEKERKTLETLLFSPISVKELFVSKLLASFLPSFAITYLAFFLCVGLVNAIAYPSLHVWTFINMNWLWIMGWFVPILLVFNILLNIFVSAKVKTFQEAQQFGGIMILPVVGLVVSQSTGLFFVGNMTLFIAGIVLLVLNLLLLKIMMKYNQRHALFESQIR